MEDKSRLVHKMVSRLLGYPDEALIGSLDEFESAAAKIPSGSKKALEDFLEGLRKTPLIAIQEEYTGTFDLNQSTCLNLTFHRWGDDKKRSTALVDLKQMYRENGYDIDMGELPDYLPMILEFLSVCPDPARFPVLEEYRGEISLLGTRLRDMGSRYALLFELLETSGGARRT